MGRELSSLERRQRAVGDVVREQPVRVPAVEVKTKLLGISKRGNGYLRKQLIHGARAAMPHLAAKPNQLGTWLQAMLARAHPNVAVVALAAKLARIAWAVLRHEKDFDRQALVAD